MEAPHRYWVDDTRIVEREWNEIEYASHNPDTRIVEKHWYNYCPVCRMYQHRALSMQDAKHRVNRCVGCSMRHIENKYSGYGFGDFEFRCMEVGTEHIDSLDCDVTYTKYF